MGQLSKISSRVGGSSPHSILSKPATRIRVLERNSVGNVDHTGGYFANASAYSHVPGQMQIKTTTPRDEKMGKLESNG